MVNQLRQLINTDGPTALTTITMKEAVEHYLRHELSDGSDSGLAYGVEAFGVMGLFIGPVVLSVTLVVLEMLRETNLDYTAAR